MPVPRERQLTAIFSRAATSGGGSFPQAPPFPTDAVTDQELMQSGTYNFINVKYRYFYALLWSVIIFLFLPFRVTLREHTRVAVRWHTDIPSFHNQLWITNDSSFLAFTAPNVNVVKALKVGLLLRAAPPPSCFQWRMSRVPTTSSYDIKSNFALVTLQHLNCSLLFFTLNFSLLPCTCSYLLSPLVDYLGAMGCRRCGRR